MPAPGLPYSGEIARKALHVIAMVMPLGMLVMPRATALSILVPLALLAASADIARSRMPTFGGWIDRTFGWMMRTSERGTERRQLFNGATWVMITAAALLLVFPAAIAAPAMVIAMIADAAAALVGRRVGRHTWPGGSRTVEGTIAFLLTGVAVAALFPSLPWSHRFAAVGAAAVAEIPPIPVNDNFLLPFCAAGVLWTMAGMPPLW